MQAATSLDDLLLAHAAGCLPEAVGLAVAVHIALKPESRIRFSRFEALGGSLLEDLPEEPISPNCFASTLARVDNADSLVDHERDESAYDCLPPAPVRDRLRSRCPADLPWPMPYYLRNGLEGLRWKRFGPIAEAMLDVGSSDLSTRLIRLQAGRMVPKHTHDGHEITVVLRGAYRDEMGRYERGDLEIADGSINHQPVAESREDCLCLAVTTAPLRLTGLFTRFLNPLIRA